MKKCPVCNTESEDYAVFCYACGYDFTHDDAEADATGEDM